jgi:hypothetical protein
MPPRQPDRILDNKERIPMERFLTPILGAAVVALLAMLVYQGSDAGRSAPVLTTPFQAVLMANGNVFFGKLENAGSPFPVLREVYYIRSQVNQETKEVKNAMIKRGSEWHAPDSMTLNARHIMVIEPVKPDSHMAKLIEEASKK